MPNLHWNKGKDAKQNPTSGTVVHITQGSPKKKKIVRINIYAIYYTGLHYTFWIVQQWLFHNRKAIQ